MSSHLTSRHPAAAVAAPPLPPRPLRSHAINLSSSSSNSSSSSSSSSSSNSSSDLIDEESNSNSDKPECPVNGVFAEDNQIWIAIKAVHKWYYDQQAIVISIIRPTPFRFLITYWRWIRILIIIAIFLYSWFLPYIALYRRASAKLHTSVEGFDSDSASGLDSSSRSDSSFLPCVSPLPSTFLPLLPSLLPSRLLSLPFRKGGLPKIKRPWCTVADVDDWDREEDKEKWTKGTIEAPQTETQLVPQTSTPQTETSLLTEEQNPNIGGQLEEVRKIEIWEQRQLLYILEAFGLISPSSSPSSSSSSSSLSTRGLGFGSKAPSHASIAVHLLSRSSLTFNQPAAFGFGNPSGSPAASRDYVYCLRCLDEYIDGSDDSTKDPTGQASSEYANSKWDGMERKWKRMIQEMSRVVKVGGVALITVDLELPGTDHYYNWWGTWSYRTKLDINGMERLIAVAEREGLLMVENIKIKEQGMSERNRKMVLNEDQINEEKVCRLEEKRKAGLLRVSERHSHSRTYFSTVSLVFVKQEESSW